MFQYLIVKEDLFAQQVHFIRVHAGTLDLHAGAGRYLIVCTEPLNDRTTMQLNDYDLTVYLQRQSDDPPPHFNYPIWCVMIVFRAIRKPTGRKQHDQERPQYHVRISVEPNGKAIELKRNDKRIYIDGMFPTRNLAEAQRDDTLRAAIRCYLASGQGRSLADFMPSQRAQFAAWQQIP